MAEYNVKSWVAFFQAFKTGAKKHDMRDLKDRNYKVGDTLNLQEYDPSTGKYTGDEMKMKITYITRHEKHRAHFPRLLLIAIIASFPSNP